MVRIPVSWFGLIRVRKTALDFRFHDEASSPGPESRGLSPSLLYNRLLPFRSFPTLFPVFLRPATFGRGMVGQPGVSAKRRTRNAICGFDQTIHSAGRVEAFLTDGPDAVSHGQAGKG